jgi:hypothetical protein
MSKRGDLREAAFRIILEKHADIPDGLPTSIRFLFYELLTARVLGEGRGPQGRLVRSADGSA